ncbi:dimethylarginine dimethylaminohydrolase family protein [Actinomycetes bacterium NPDC127524]
MINAPKNEAKAFCASEYDTLKEVIVCEPQYMSIREVINETQKHFKNENIHIERAMKQHNEFVQVMESQGINVIKLPSLSAYPEQVFTRDIGFTIGDTVFVAEMASPIRQGEETILQSWLQDRSVQYHNLTKERIEGGDVVVDRNTIYVGVSNRTHETSIRHLQSLLPGKEVMPVPFAAKYLHLDCVFNVLSPDEAIIFPNVISKTERELLSKRYDLIEISEEEQFTLGTNVLSIGNKKVLSLPVNKNVNKELRRRGYDVIEVDITEIIKSGGSFRCCTMPLFREPDQA